LALFLCSLARSLIYVPTRSFVCATKHCRRCNKCGTEATSVSGGCSASESESDGAATWRLSACKWSGSTSCPISWHRIASHLNPSHLISPRLIVSFPFFVWNAQLAGLPCPPSVGYLFPLFCDFLAHICSFAEANAATKANANQ